MSTIPQATKTQLANEGENVERKPKDDRKSLTARVKPERLPILNQRLKLFGFDSVNEMVHAFIEGKFPQINDDRQIDNLVTNESTNGQKSLLEGVYNPDFYQSVDFNDMYNYYCDILKLHPKTCRDLVSYFRRFRQTFFTEKAQEIRSLTPRMRSKILDAFRKFRQYYLYKFNNDQCAELTAKIIRRYNLNVGNNDHGRLYIVDDNYLANKVKLLMSIKGELGLIVRFGLFSGLREEEMIYVHGKQLCENLGGCDCSNLHVLNKQNGMSIILIQWHRGQKKCYFTIVPTALWHSFRKLPSLHYRPHITSAHAYLKSKDPTLHFMWLRKAHYNIMCRSMKPFEANILAGRAKSVDAKHYAMYELDVMSENYANAWKRFGIEENRNCTLELTL
jgi:intergrase/recombinase